MGFYYSPVEGAFFADGLFSRESVPADAVHISDELHASLMAEQSRGAVIAPGGDGFPVARHRSQTVMATRAELIRRVNGIYQQHMAAIANDYPLHERESWPVQLEEAKALQANPEATTPWLDACAGARGLDKAELAARVLAKDTAYRLISGNLSGIRQRHEDAIAKLETVEQAQGYDVHAWWPSEEGEPQQ